MADIFPLQQDVNRKAALHVYFGPQVVKCRNGVSIILEGRAAIRLGFATHSSFNLTAHWIEL